MGDGKHHDGYSWAWKKPIITIVIISLTAINNSRFVITNSLANQEDYKSFSASVTTDTNWAKFDMSEACTYSARVPNP